MSTNAIFLVGRLTQAPETRYTNNGKAVTSFTLAVNKQGKDAGADFIPVVAWEKLAETSANYLDKGSKVLVNGRLQIRSYDDKDGNKRRIAEVVAQGIEFLDSNKAAGGETDMSDFGKDIPSDEIGF